MKKIIYCLIPAALLLTSCTTAVPVVGQFTHAKDNFMGEAQVGMGGSGTLRIRSQSGVSCSGALVRPTSLVSGEGTLQCADGRTGSFVFTKKTEMGGDGFGTLSDGEKFRFHFGMDGRYTTTKCDKSTDSTECSSY